MISIVTVLLYLCWMKDRSAEPQQKSTNLTEALPKEELYSAQFIRTCWAAVRGDSTGHSLLREPLVRYAERMLQSQTQLPKYTTSV
ncbi:uncharacterized protein EI90DRAFT_3051655 [Cantharellus anzutake]|uniref:uncharacterized protein n=1 Tax=Cantharellus anzutake TaxID=1750568 RepID=UPI00190787DD|nr:uncharacterized protein EI90DRAFT_3051655 [Cantharellus anzutake]KAF8334266.1 hypothetical protein EI90DRAFT_3051655 [Cantharellus anzutake]